MLSIKYLCVKASYFLLFIFANFSLLNVFIKDAFNACLKMMILK